MKRATDSAEQAFGSDSFLDIIANIVGILIILIVLAGLRVSQFPVAVTQENDPPDVARDDSVDTKVTIAHEDVAPPPLDESTPDPIRETLPLPIPPTLDSSQITTAKPAPAQDLEEEFRLLGDEVELLRKSLASIQSQQSMAHGRQNSLQSELSTASSLLKQHGQSVAKGEEQVFQLAKSIEDLKAQVVNLRQKLSAIENVPPPTEKIEHRVTQISHDITGKEIHFRLLKDRVAQVPIQQLIERLKPQIERNRNWLAQYGRQRGTVGPVNGFSMKYIVAKQRLTPLEELNYGHGAVRIGISEWSIDEEPDLETETAEEALRQGSRFFGDLMLAEPDTTLTFWVYPDSFGIYRELQKAARQYGFTVAARPLPFGIPIAGSPQGSRSAGQ